MGSTKEQQPLQEDLIVAFAFENAEGRVKKLLADGCPVDKADQWGDTALHAAALCGHLSLIKLLLEKGAKPNHQNNVGSTPLHKAVAGGKVEAAKLLLEAGANAELANQAGRLPEDYTDLQVLRNLLLGNSGVTITIPVAKRLHSRIIGKGGKTLKDIKKQSGADITIPPAQEEGDGIIVRGREESAKKAVALITAIIKEQQQAANGGGVGGGSLGSRGLEPGHTSVRLDVPKDLHKLVIGTKGKKIKEISSLGVRVRVPLQDEQEHLVTITGPKDAVEKAVKLVEECTGLYLSKHS
ncbi:Ankyrin 1 [Balamuthia mandrillaris]